MSLDAILGGSGLTVLAFGALLSNLAVSSMAKVVKMHWRVGGKGDAAADRLSRAVIREYRRTHVNGILFRNLVIAYVICGIGAALVIASAVVGKKF
jgi:hypothetical protein